jgi:WD domain, G-beta repeat
VWQWRATERARAEAERLRERADFARGEADLARGREAEARGEAERQREKFERLDYGRMIQDTYKGVREADIRVAIGGPFNSARVDLRGWEWEYVSSLMHAALPRDEFVPDRVWNNTENVLVLRLPELLTAGVYSATFSPDGSRIVTGSEDKTARVWDARSGAPVLELKGHTAAVRSATFSPDGSRIVTGTFGKDQTARVWDARSGAPVVVLGSEIKWHSVRLATFSPDGSVVLTGSDWGVEAWDARTGHKLKDLGVLGRNFAMVFSLDGLRGVSKRAYETQYVWDAFGRQNLDSLFGHNPASATFSPGGSRVITGNDDGTAQVWDAQTGALVLELKVHTGAVRSVTFSPDGTRLLTGSEDGTARVWYGAQNHVYHGSGEWFGSQLKLMSWGDGSRVPTSDRDLVIVGNDGDNLLHIRTFDLVGNRIDTFETRDSNGALHLESVGTPWGPESVGNLSYRSDALESSLLTTQSRAISTLKQHLAYLLPPHILSGADRGQVLSAVTLIIGNRRAGPLSPPPRIHIGNRRAGPLSPPPRTFG